MVIKNTKPQGFIAMVSLLIVASVAMSFSIRILLQGVDNARLSLDSIYYEKARFNITSCLEDTLMRMTQQAQFNRSLNYNLGEGNSCTTEMTWSAPQTLPGAVERLVTVKITGISNGFKRTFGYDLRQSAYDVNNVDGSLKHLNNIDFITIQELPPA